eukprot:11679-Chlamydomonas_euryale.AAC.5
MIAGATAGTVEHTAMYPVDTIKTRMQVWMVWMVPRQMCGWCWGRGVGGGGRAVAVLVQAWGHAVGADTRSEGRLVRGCAGAWAGWEWERFTRVWNL